MNEVKTLFSKKYLVWTIAGLVLVIGLYLMLRKRSSSSFAGSPGAVTLPSANGSGIVLEPPAYAANISAPYGAATSSFLPGTSGGLNSSANGITQSFGASTQPVFPAPTPATPPPITQSMNYSNSADGNGVSTIVNSVAPFAGYEAQLNAVTANAPSPVLWLGNVPVVNAPSGINQSNVSQVFASGVGNAQEVIFAPDPQNPLRTVPTYVSPGMPGFVPVAHP